MVAGRLQETARTVLVELPVADVADALQLDSLCPIRKALERALDQPTRLVFHQLRDGFTWMMGDERLPLRCVAAPTWHMQIFYELALRPREWVPFAGSTQTRKQLYESLELARENLVSSLASLFTLGRNGSVRLRTRDDGVVEARWIPPQGAPVIAFGTNTRLAPDSSEESTRLP